MTFIFLSFLIFLVAIYTYISNYTESTYVKVIEIFSNVFLTAFFCFFIYIVYNIVKKVLV